jgi:DNA polymerase-3 subunit epsilon
MDILATPIENVRFVVVDVETTGGTTGDHRMTEIAMCVVEDDAIVRRYESLMNPRQPIPEFIQLMTGITPEMVANAPEEDYALAPVISEIHADDQVVVFVGHNVGFDWSFVKSAIERMGEVAPDIPRLCTCRLSRRLSTGLAKHNLGSVAEHYGCVISARHRAMGDTEATAEVLLHLIERARNEHDAVTLEDLFALQHVQKSTSKALSTTAAKRKEQLAPYLRELPDESGVYYFLNAKKHVLYVGKAKSLRTRVNQYFNDAPLHGRSVQKMIRYVRHIQWETTGTELAAMLLESREIKDRLPLHNVASRKYRAPAFLKITNEDFPRLELASTIEDDGAEYFGPFRSHRMAERIMDMVVRENKLRTCNGALFPHADIRPCFDYHIKRCNGPCALHQTIDDYRDSIEDARKFLSNVEEGAIGRLRTQMELAAAELDFERAAMLRDGVREVERATIHATDRPLAVSDTNVLIFIPVGERNATVEVYAMRSGRLVFQREVGLRAPRAIVIEAIESHFTKQVEPKRFTSRELDELQIITSWLYRKRERAHTAIVQDAHVIPDLIHEAFNSFDKDRVQRSIDAPPSEYSQLPEYDDFSA